MIPLTDIRILDLSRVLAGPYATMILGDLGADVIKVEAPGTGDISRHSAPFINGESHYFLSINRNKRSISLDLKTPEGAATCRRLAAASDVVIQNFRPGVMERLGLGYDELVAENPGLIMCSISGFGQDGPLQDRPAFDVIIQALSGAMSVNGDPNGPPVRLAIPMGDLGGGLYTCIAVLSALHERAQTGVGRHVDVALYDCMVSLLGYLTGLYFANGESPARVGSGHHSVGPIGAFTTSDGYIVLGIFTGKFWRMFCDAIGQPDLSQDPRFRRTQDRVSNMSQLTEILNGILAEATTDHWEGLLLAEGIPASRIMDVGEVMEAEHTAYRGLVETVTHKDYGKVRQLAPTLVEAGGDRAEIRLPPPVLGEHSGDVLRDVLHMTDDEIAALFECGALHGSEKS